MKKQRLFFILFLSLLCFTNCDSKKEIDLSNLNGYWEIDSVFSANGNEKKFNFNEFIEFFKTKDSIGFRSKLKPNFRGTYEGNKRQQEYKIVFKDGVYQIIYTNKNSSWSETLIEASTKRLSLKNLSGDLYHYRPYTPISL